MKATVPDGRKGAWIIDTLHLDDDDAIKTAMVAMVRGDEKLMCPAGTYKRLRNIERKVVVMSNTPMEVNSNQEFVNRAHGKVLINGLGIGMVLEAVLGKPDVAHVTVVEVSQDLIDLVAPHFQSFTDAGRLTIVQGDAFEHPVNEGDFYDVIWHDIWDDISPANCEAMIRLREKYKGHCAWQGYWSEDMIREMFVSTLSMFGTVNESKLTLDWMAKLDHDAHQHSLQKSVGLI